MDVTLKAQNSSLLNRLNLESSGEECQHRSTTSMLINGPAEWTSSKKDSAEIRSVVEAGTQKLMDYMENKFARLEATITRPEFSSQNRPSNIPFVASLARPESAHQDSTLVNSTSQCSFGRNLADCRSPVRRPAPSLGRSKTVISASISASSEVRIYTPKYDEYAKKAISYIEDAQYMHTVQSLEPADAVTKGYPWVLRPSSRFRLTWDCIGIMFIFSDLLLVPVQLSFQPRFSDPTKLFLFWTTITFWTLDMGLSFNTGFYRRGIQVLNPKEIARHYLRTWFGFDLMVIFADWITYFAEDGRAPALARIGKSLRIFRAARSLRLLRLVKFQKLIETVMDHIDSEHFVILLSILKGTVFILATNHIIACGWYGIAQSTYRNTDSWILHANWADDDSFLMEYLTCLHWSLTQFTPASMEVYPRNIFERGFAVLTLIFALIVFSSFVSSITSAMTQLRQLSFAADKNMSLLRKFLRTNKISMPLCIRIFRYVGYKMQKKKQVLNQSDVRLLGVLSLQLQMELVQEIVGPTLCSHFYIQQYALASPSTMCKICSFAVTQQSFSSGDTVFTKGSVCESMKFLTKGSAKYFSANISQRSSCGTDVEAGAWSSEAALWTHWKHTGWMTASQNTEFICLQADVFLDISRQNEHIWNGCIVYGTKFLRRLNQHSLEGTASDLHDRGFAATRKSFFSHLPVPDASSDSLQAKANQADRKPDSRLIRAWSHLLGFAGLKKSEPASYPNNDSSAFNTTFSDSSSEEKHEEENWRKKQSQDDEKEVIAEDETKINVSPRSDSYSDPIKQTL